MYSISISTPEGVQVKYIVSINTNCAPLFTRVSLNKYERGDIQKWLDQAKVSQQTEKI